MLQELKEIDRTLDRAREMCCADVSIPHGLYQIILEAQGRLFALESRLGKELLNADN